MKLLKLLLIAIFGLAPSGLFAATIGAGERVSITIKGVPSEEQSSINGEYIVSDSGLIYMPMLSGGLKASGSTGSTVARRIEAAYKSANIYTNPRITIITVKDQAQDAVINRKFVTVAGHVKRPGPVQFTENMTIYEAVASAGDASTFGAMNRVELMRNGKKYIYNLKTTKHRSLRVYPNDVITVPQKSWTGN